MISLDNITALILAGGKSTRMGKDKSLLKWQGMTYIEHVIKAAKPLCSNIFISANHHAYDQLGYQIIKDLQNDKGPLEGLTLGLEHTKTPYLMVLTCDLPMIRTEILSHLIISPLNSGIRMFRINDQTQPLTALYSQNCLDHIRSHYSAGEHSVKRAIKGLNIEYVDVKRSEEHYFSNINTPEDLDKLK